MWLLNWLPDFVFHLILIVGLLGLLVSWIFKSVPFVSAYALQIQVIAIILTVLGVWYEGGIAKDKEYRVRIAEMQLRVSKAETQAAEANAKLSEQILKEQQRIKDVTAENKRKLQEQAAQLNKQCTVNQGVIDILNNAAKNKKEKTK